MVSDAQQYTGSQLGNISTSARVAVTMAPKTIESAGFRPNEVEAKIILAAERATGRNRSYLLRRCMARAISDVVKEIIESHHQDVRHFELVLKETEGSTLSDEAIPEPNPTYKGAGKSSGKRKPKAA